MLGLFLVAFSGCAKSVCETKNDCPVGNVCNSGACIKPCTADTDCPNGKFCDAPTGLCATGCRDSSDCPGGGVCAQNQCWATTSPAQSADGGLDDGGSLACRCLQAPRACLEDINPASTTAGTLVCEPGAPARATALFFGNVGCSHCQHIFGNLLLIESELRSEGFDPMLVFAQLATYTHTGEEVASTFPTHTGPVLQDTANEDMWRLYGADWYEVKIIDAHGCLSAFFNPIDTMNLIADGQLQASGTLLKDAWRSAMGGECHPMPDAGADPGVGP
jgi:Cys-rich repeat protein